MLGRMKRTRMAALAVLAVIIAAACQSKLNNGEECLKNSDCESDRCIAHVCVDPNSSRVPTTTTDAGSADATDAAAADTADSAPPKDTAIADSAEVGSETSSDTGAD